MVNKKQDTSWLELSLAKLASFRNWKSPLITKTQDVENHQTSTQNTRNSPLCSTELGSPSMMDQKRSARNDNHFKKRKAKIKTNKILDRLTFNPQKHKKKMTRKPREKLQLRPEPRPAPTTQHLTTIKFGSFNVNGLDLDSTWTVEQLLSSRGFDVRNYKNYHCHLH